MSTTILLVEDDDRARALLSDVLERAGYHMTVASSGEIAIKFLEQQHFDIVVTDIKMRRIDGIQVLTIAKQQPSPPAVILLTGFGSLETSIAALRAGAYDYLLKPCAPDDLLACVAGAVQRHRDEQRHIDAVKLIARGLDQLNDIAPGSAAKADEEPSPPAHQLLRVGELAIDQLRHAVSFAGQLLHVTPIEYALLSCLAEMQGQVLNYREIVRRTHGYDADDIEAQTLLKAHMRNLRRKIDPAYLVSVRGVGYMLVAPYPLEGHPNA